MLKIEEIDSSLTSKIEVDEYVPFSILFGEESLSPPLYWRGGDGKFSLVEIALNRKSGAIQGLTLTSLDIDNVRKANGFFSEEFTEEGIPVCDLSEWCAIDSSGEFSSNFHDEFNLKMELEVGQNFVLLTLSKEDMATRYIRNNNVRFGVNSSGYLCSIWISELSISEVETIVSAID